MLAWQDRSKACGLFPQAHIHRDSFLHLGPPPAQGWDRVPKERLEFIRDYVVVGLAKSTRKAAPGLHAELEKRCV